MERKKNGLPVDAIKAIMKQNEIIENTVKAQKRFGFGYGAAEIFLSQKEMVAIGKGKCLAVDTGEYSIFVTLNESESDNP